MIACTKYDELTEADLKSVVLEWFRAAQPVSDDLVHAHFHSLSPRVIFLKNLQPDSTLLDLGAGDGTLSVFRHWPLYPRPDLRMLALSLEKGQKFDNYEAYELKNFETGEPIFPGEKINAVVCAHFIEHMNDPRATINFLGDRLEQNARIYMEWPHPISEKMPSITFFKENNIAISTTNFRDDLTHVQAWDMPFIIDLLDKAGFNIESTGRLYMPFLADRMRDNGAVTNETVDQTLAFWTKFGWAQHLIAVKR